MKNNDTTIPTVLYNNCKTTSCIKSKMNNFVSDMWITILYIYGHVEQVRQVRKSEIRTMFIIIGGWFTLLSFNMVGSFRKSAMVDTFIGAHRCKWESLNMASTNDQTPIGKKTSLFRALRSRKQQENLEPGAISFRSGESPSDLSQSKIMKPLLKEESQTVESESQSKISADLVNTKSKRQNDEKFSKPETMPRQQPIFEQRSSNEFDDLESLLDEGSRYLEQKSVVISPEERASKRISSPPSTRKRVSLDDAKIKEIQDLIDKRFDHKYHREFEEVLCQ